MVWAKILVGGFAFAVIAGAAAPAVAHSLEELEGKLKKGEKYLQVLHETASEFTLKDARDAASAWRTIVARSWCSILFT